MLALSIYFLLAIHVVVSLLIILLVLMQKPKSEGLGAAFGGGMMEGLMGAQASNVLASATRWLGGIFFLLTLLLAILYAKQSSQHSAIQAAAIRAAAMAAPVPSASPASSAAALSGTAALSGSGAAFSGSELKLGAPASSPADSLLPASSPANSLLPAPTLGATPAPAASPFKAKPGLSGTAGH